MIFLRTKTGRLIFGESVMKVLNQYRQLKSSDKEAGGVLLGRHLLYFDSLVVDEVTTPQKTDGRSRRFFFRGEKHNNLARAHWIQSNKTCTYLGLWHTHPEVNPTPSNTDIKDWRNALKRHKYEGEYLYFAIVGTESICVWEGFKDLSIIQLTEVSLVENDYDKT